MIPPSSSPEHSTRPANGSMLPEGAQLKTALVCMPFASTRHPSIQLGLLSSAARARGFAVDCFYFNLTFACQIGQQQYFILSEYRGRQLGDWLFSIQAFRDEAPEGNLLEHMPEHAQRAQTLLRTRNEEIPLLLDRLVQAVEWSEYGVVGFTASFQQNVASFALARRLKEEFPQLITVFGGSNFDGEMGLELTRSIDVIDYAVIGEGDAAFPDLLLALYEGRDPLAVPGVVAKRGGVVSPPQPGFIRDMDALPVPDYAAFYEQRNALRPPAGEKWEDDGVPFESARGCWWGERHHCIFCGLNTNKMKFRAKSVSRTLSELEELTHRYGSFRFCAVDNIMDQHYVEQLFASLTERHLDFDFFYEVKANLSRDQIRTLRRGGVSHVQPGIESLNSNVLRLMKKGTTRIQNINTLRWMHYYELNTLWNILYGLPGEKPEDYQQQAELIPLITHLPPPHFRGRIWMERFSPIFLDREAYPARRMAPEMSYRYIYPNRCDLDKIAYFFDYELENTLPDEAYESMCQAIKHWQALWKQSTRPYLIFRYSSRRLKIVDGRNPGRVQKLSYEDPLYASVYLACSDKPRSPQSINRQLDVSTGCIEKILETFVNAGVMMQEGSRFLSLALPATKHR